jgi:transposase-like protein
MSRKSSPQRVAFWRRLIARRRRSQHSVERLCQEAGVAPASFYHWQRKLREAAAGPPACDRELVPVRIVPAPAVPPAGMIEIEWPDRVRLRIPPSCDPAALRLVWELLGDGQPRGAG